ncbi:MAG: cobyrinic acid a,c-diamide synthase [Cyanobacteriota bacterium]|nr:cobyrinic acid a,c-diamide synthase [Cyanobacteriota bacterium]
MMILDAPPLVLENAQLGQMLDKLPPEVRQWAESLDWKQRRYLLSLCYLLCSASPDVQIQFLDEYTADGLIAKIVQDYDTQIKVQAYLNSYHVKSRLTPSLLRVYIRQYYIHSAQDVRRQPEKYLESALRLGVNPTEKNYVLNYILGFEILKMMFKMSWMQHERLYSLQSNQEEFYFTYIKPIQKTHILNGIINPKDRNLFFAKRNYFIQVPQLSEKKVTELVMLAFTTDIVSYLGFAIVRNLSHLNFDYDYIFQPEPEGAFE